ncbi:MAG: hypothetical protein Q9160_006770 [Pyrenula sp. 1 TL-2023]
MSELWNLCAQLQSSGKDEPISMGIVLDKILENGLLLELCRVGLCLFLWSTYVLALLSIFQSLQTRLLKRCFPTADFLFDLGPRDSLIAVDSQFVRGILSTHAVAYVSGLLPGFTGPHLVPGLVMLLLLPLSKPSRGSSGQSMANKPKVAKAAPPETEATKCKVADVDAIKSGESESIEAKVAPPEATEREPVELGSCHPDDIEKSSAPEKIEADSDSFETLSESLNAEPAPPEAAGREDQELESFEMEIAELDAVDEEFNISDRRLSRGLSARISEVEAMFEDMSQINQADQN